MLTRFFIYLSLTAGFTPAMVRADWGEMLPVAMILSSGLEPSLAWVGADRAVLTFARESGGNQRVFAARYDGGAWSVVAGNTPVDEGFTGGHIRPIFAGDGAGHGLLVYQRYDGAAWRLVAREYDGVNFADVNGGVPLDQGPVGNVSSAAAASLGDGRWVVVYAQFNGVRPACYAVIGAGTSWMPVNGGQAIDDLAGGWSDAPTVATDRTGHALVAFTQQVNGMTQLRVARLDGDGTVTNEPGVNIAQTAVGPVATPRLAALSDGAHLLVWLQEDANGVRRLLGRRRQQGTWANVNNGAPLDSSPNGVGALAVAPDRNGHAIIVYATDDQVDYAAAPMVRSVRVSGLAAVALKGGGDLADGSPAAVSGLAVAISLQGHGLTVMASSKGGSLALGTRGGTFALAQAAPVEDKVIPVMQVTQNVFRPANGERMKVTYPVAPGQRLRVTLHTLSGTFLRELDNSTVPGNHVAEWDGRDAQPGIYLLVADLNGARRMDKIAVVR